MQVSLSMAIRVGAAVMLLLILGAVLPIAAAQSVRRSEPDAGWSRVALSGQAVTWLAASSADPLRLYASVYGLGVY